MKSIKFFRQRTGETCGISCILMILHYYKCKDEHGEHFATPRKERVFYDRYGAKATRGTLATGIARALTNNHLDARIVYSSTHPIDNVGGYFSDEVYRKVCEEENEKISEAQGRFTAEMGAHITPDDVKGELLKGRLVVLQIMYGEKDEDRTDDYWRGQDPHWILLHDYENDRFIGRDPAKGYKEWTREMIEECIDTPFGRTYISVQQKK